MIRALTLAISLLITAPLAAVTPPPARPAAMDSSPTSASVRSKSDGWMIPPGKTGSLGLEFAFMTSPGPLNALIGNPILRFTDVVFLRLQGRYSVGGVAELVVDASLLPKQPSFTEELVFQNAGFGLRFGLTDWLAAALRFDGGTTLEKSGAWGQAAVGLEARLPISDYVQFDLGLLTKATSLFIDDDAPRFLEVGATGQIVFFNPGVGGVWLGTSFYFPVATKPTDLWPIDPNVRVGVDIGAVLSAIDKWDLYMKYAFIDRGDLINYDTILPILDGGFDQQVLTVGLVRRFGDEPSGRR